MVEYIKTAHLKHKTEWFEWLPVSNRGVCGSEEGMFCKTIDCLPCPSCCMENKRGVVRNLGKIWLDACVKMKLYQAVVLVENVMQDQLWRYLTDILTQGGNCVVDLGYFVLICRWWVRDA